MFEYGTIYEYQPLASGTGFFELREGKNPEEILVIVKSVDINGYNAEDWFKQPDLVREDTRGYYYISHEVIRGSVITKIGKA